MGSSKPIDENLDIHSSQRTMIIVRWVGVPWALFQVLVYEKPYPDGFFLLGLLLVAGLAAGNLAIQLWHRRPKAVERARRIAAVGLGLDVFVLVGFVWLYTFDDSSALWALLFILPLEGAVSFQLRGALFAWVSMSILYTMREVWGSGHYDYPLELNSITFRMGIAGIVALVAGLMARDLVGQRSQLRETLDELKRIDRLRLGLVSTLGHDVRSPLTVIRGSISTVLRLEKVFSHAQTKDLLLAADRHARRLETLANDLLDLARLEEGRLDLRLADVPLADVLAKTLSYIDAEHEVQVELEPSVSVRADPRRLEQIAYNLIANALRHGEPPFIVRAAIEGEAVCLDICDGGEGVAPAQKKHLFEPFQSETEDGSVGYGLAIVKALAEAQGGEVSYRDMQPRGACFTVRLPVSPEASTVSQQRFEGQEESEKIVS